MTMISRSRSDCNKHTHYRCHWTKKNGKWKVKRAFKDEEEALDYINVHFKKCGYVAYVCKECGKIHIGKESI